MNEERLHEVLEAACRFFENRLEESHVEVLKENYSLSAEMVEEARIGYAPLDEDGLRRWLDMKQFGPKEIQVTGLVTQDLGQMWRGRLVFPYLVEGEARYFIAREMPETDDFIKGKYGKQARNPDYVHEAVEEPVFGRSSVEEGKPLIVTEGVTDCLAAQQAGYASIAPVTTQFKGDALERVLKLCEAAEPLYIVMDSEEPSEGEKWGPGLQGAVKTGLNLSRKGLFPLLGQLPRPDDVGKVDLADFLKNGGDLERVLQEAEFVEMHPLAEEIKSEERRKAVEEWNRERRREMRKELDLPNRGREELPDPEAVREALPSIATFFGGEEGRNVPHPVHGSSNGANFLVDEGGDSARCWRKGHEMTAGPLYWFAVQEGVIACGDPYPSGKEFVEALKGAAEYAEVKQ